MKCDEVAVVRGERGRDEETALCVTCAEQPYAAMSVVVLARVSTLGLSDG